MTASALVALADKARESTFPFLASDSVADCHREAYALTSVLFSEATLIAAAAAAAEAGGSGSSSTSTSAADVVAAAKGALRAIDLAILRGGGAWSAVAKKVILRVRVLQRPLSCN